MENKTYYVYIIYNLKREKIYIGFTSDLEKRLKQHNKILPSKNTSFTSINSGKWFLAYKERLCSLNDVKKREKWLKSGVGREFIHQNLNHWLKQAQLVDPPQADF